MVGRRNHEQTLNKLGLDNAADCSQHSTSEEACRKAKCSYRPPGYISSAVCYDPEKEVPGYVWGTWSVSQKADVFSDASGLLRKRLRNKNPFPGRRGYDRLKALSSQVDPAPLTDEEQALIDQMRRRATQIYDELKRNKAFNEADITIMTRDVKGNRTVVELVPGDQIFRRGAFGIKAAEHHGVYIGRGLVIEVGGGGIPAISGLDATLCALDLKSSPAQGIVGLSSLDEFNKPNSETVKIEYRSADRLPRAETIRHAISLIGRWNYKLQRSNCEHFATYVTTGQWKSNQIRRIYDASDTYVVKPLHQVLKLLSPSETKTHVVSRCRFKWSTEQCKEAGLGEQSVLLSCGLRSRQQESCYNVQALARELRRQKRARQPYHDPETGYYLSPKQVKLIAKVAASKPTKK